MPYVYVKMSNHIVKLFSLPSSETILVFNTKSHGNILRGRQIQVR